MMNDREKLIDLIASYMEFVRTATPKEMATYLIANGVVVRERGEWLHSKRVAFAQECSVCGGVVYWDECGCRHDYDFCPNCGADMRKGENDGEVH